MIVLLLIKWFENDAGDSIERENGLYTKILGINLHINEGQLSEFLFRRYEHARTFLGLSCDFLFEYRTDEPKRSVT